MTMARPASSAAAIDLVVAHRAARLDHGGHAGVGQHEQPVGEGEEGVAGPRAALGPLAGLLHGDLGGDDPGLLPGAHADGLAVR